MILGMLDITKELLMKLGRAGIPPIRARKAQERIHSGAWRRIEGERSRRISSYPCGKARHIILDGLLPPGQKDRKPGCKGLQVGVHGPRGQRWEAQPRGVLGDAVCALATTGSGGF